MGGTWPLHSASVLSSSHPLVLNLPTVAYSQGNDPYTSLIQAWQNCVRCIKLTEVDGVAKAKEYQIPAGGQNTREGGLKVTREEILTTRHLVLLTRDTNVKFSQVKPELSSTKQSGDGQSYPK